MLAPNISVFRKFMLIVASTDNKMAGAFQTTYQCIGWQRRHRFLVYISFIVLFHPSAPLEEAHYVCQVVLFCKKEDMK